MSDERSLLTKEQQEEALRRAHESAAFSDPIGMVEALFQSYALDGLIRSIKRKWDIIPLDEIQFIVASAVDVLYKDIESKKKILNLVAYLYRVADYKAHQYYNIKIREKEANDDLQYRLPKKQLPAQEATEQAVEEDGLDHDKRRAQAIAIARRIIPRIGQKNIQDVMTLIVDAIEGDRQDLPNEEIADALDLLPATVRQLRHRGFERLTQRAREEGIIAQKIDFTSLGFDEDSDISDDSEEE